MTEKKVWVVDELYSGHVIPWAVFESAEAALKAVTDHYNGLQVKRGLREHKIQMKPMKAAKAFGFDVQEIRFNGTVRFTVRKYTYFTEGP